MNNLLAQLSRKFLTDLNRHSQMFASPLSVIFIYCLKQIPVVLQTEIAQKCESSQMYFFFLFLSELKKEEKKDHFKELNMLWSWNPDDKITSTPALWKCCHMAGS